MHRRTWGNLLPCRSSTIHSGHRKQDQGDPSVTDVTPYWGQPVFKEVAYAEGSAIDFTTASSRKQQLDASLAQNIPKRQRKKARPNIEKTTQDELKLFYDTIQFKNSKIKPAILSLVNAYAADYSSSTDKLESLTSLNDDMLKGADFQTILSKSEHIFTCGKLSLDVKECQLVEQKTRNQAKSALWHCLRAGRVTASKLHQVCHTNPAKPSVSLIMQLCKPAKNSKQTPAMKWGTEQESTARKHYEQQVQAHHSDFNVRTSGLVLNPKYPHMAASPDGICQCTCCGIGCIEIKCPFSARDMTVSEALALPGFPLQFDETKLTLKPTHPYYAQVQCQMFISNTQYCDFVVWTQKDLFVERISRDEDFWADACNKAEHFFKVVALPELLCGYFTQNQKASTSLTPVNSAQHGGIDLPPPLSPSKSVNMNTKCIKAQKTWCSCKGPETGDMIGCDSKQCPEQWFHFVCVKIERAPKGQWFCPQCRHKPQFQKNKSQPNQK